MTELPDAPWAKDSKADLPDAPWAMPEASAITTRNVIDSALNIPVIAPLARKADAAIRATVSGDDPIWGDQPTWGDRYTKWLHTLEDPMAKFSQQHPVLDTALGFPATAAASMALPGAGIVGSAATGAGISAGDAALRGENPATAGLTGGAFGAAAPVIARGVTSALGGRAASAATPTTTELKASAKAGYEHPIVKDVEFKPQAVSDLSDKIQNDLVQAGFRPRSSSAAGTFAELADMKPPAGAQSVGVDDLDNIRRGLGVLAKQRDPVGMPTAEASAAGRAIGHIDEFLPNLKQPDLLRGDAQAASKILTDARGDYRAYKQAQLAETKMENARIQAASTYGGGNINNALRQAYRPLEVNNFAKSSNWSPAAQAALKDVVEGNLGRNIARDIGRNAPTGPVNIALHAHAAALTGGLTLPLAAGAYVAKKVGESGTKRAATRLSEVIRSESPLARKQAAGAPPALSPQQQALLQTLLRTQSLRGGSPVPLLQQAPLYFPGS